MLEWLFINLLRSMDGMMNNMESRWHFIYWKYHKHTCFINFASSLTFYMFSFEYIYIYLYIYIKTLPTTLRFRPFFEKPASVHPHPLRFHALATLVSYISVLVLYFIHTVFWRTICEFGIALDILQVVDDILIAVAELEWWIEDTSNKVWGPEILRF